MELHHLWWLCSLTLERQSLRHLAQMKLDDTETEAVLAFLLALFAACWSSLAASAIVTPSLTVALQSWRLSAVASQVLGSMSASFMSRLQTSLKRSWGLPVGVGDPSHSSPYRMTFGMRPVPMWHMCPSHPRCLWPSSENRLGMPAHCRTSVLVTLSCHLRLMNANQQKLFKNKSPPSFFF